MLIQTLQQLLAESLVTDHEPTLTWLNTATFKTNQSSKVLVQTNSINDIVKLLRFCNEHQHTLYVISAGKNWGYGSAVPPQDVSILLDLSPMNQIISYDPNYGTLRCEAGVTFKQVADFLKQNGNKHFLSIIGGDPNASVIGNILERGDGVGPYCERSEYACSPEVILPDGTLLDVGMGNIKNSKLSDLHKHSTGPSFQELFFQSNYGIVTKMTLWLCAVPQNFHLFHFYLKPQHSFVTILQILRKLYVQRVLNSPITFWNDYKQMANITQFPPNYLGPLSRQNLAQISNHYTTWFAFGGIYIDDKKLSKTILSVLFGKLKGNIVPRTFFSVLSAHKVGFFRWANRWLRHTPLNSQQILQLWDENPLLGNPSTNSLKSLFWRKPKEIPATIDPQTERCGLHWNAFVMPFDGELIANTLQQMETIIFKHGYEPIISLVLLNDRYVRVFQQLIYDREQPSEDIRALVCHTELVNFLHTSGFSFTRLGILQMQQDSTFLKNDFLQNKIKEVLDPRHILAPSRYGIY